DHLARCHFPSVPLANVSPPVPIPGLLVYETPQPGREYLISADPAEGDPNSDPSTAIVWDADNATEAAHLWGRFEPTSFASFLGHLGHFYNDAIICVERNNHGHAVHLALSNYNGTDEEYTPRIYISRWDNKKGWLSNAKNKTLAMDYAAGVFRDAACVIRTRAIVDELAGIRASQLSAHSGQHDDRAMAAIIGLAALHWPGLNQGKCISYIIPPIDPLDRRDSCF
ncbi:MAG: hypothetical protein JXA42_08570, partial [Anaerolineales bacterium]|nr:hypothetical protein [Anaerolineales bacterium]